MRGIAPGVYNVYAWSALEYPSQAGNPRHLDPAFLGSFERRRQEISVVEKENRTLTLTLD
jgi:hypothetical protein